MQGEKGQGPPPPPPQRFRADLPAPAGQRQTQQQLQAAQGAVCTNCPRELVGKAFVTKDKKRCCFGWNMAVGCPEEGTKPAGAQCSKGWHGWCEPKADGTACGEPYKLANHTR